MPKAHILDLHVWAHEKGDGVVKTFGLEGAEGREGALALLYFEKSWVSCLVSQGNVFDFDLLMKGCEVRLHFMLLFPS
ncbi:hypothetical protein [Bartonella tribocorum]|uniref:Uncharacterized protein n=1 Tax=Bartonella tribocorum TaxID=85701 RepID=A0A2M6USN6_9HYPH|nr:hypothetical protein [Bartonella tribocorum]PIT69166.1 hypothetical protein CEV08_06730 [Bartonella tribocorum]